MSKEISNQLWIDKYRPKNYTELLTDERINREILTWVKSWDEIVFHKKFNLPKIPQYPTNEFSTSNQIGGNVQNNKQFFFKKDQKTPYSSSNAKPGFLSPFGNKFFKQPYEIDYLQSKYKIILISGPPGIGKTTLASIIAKQCGYEPIIINASDERTIDKLMMRIYDSTLIQNLNKTKKPTCLILDEIDGIAGDNSGKNSIKSIIDFIKCGKVNNRIMNKTKTDILKSNIISKMLFNKDNVSKAKENKIDEDFSDQEDNDKDNDNIRSDDEEDKNKGSKKSKKAPLKTEGLKRPIICICNDIYAKVLAPLRKEALVYNIKKTDEKKILDRLNEICKLEHLGISRNSIRLLCEKTKYDIRATLNSLQFISYNQLNSNLILSLSSSSSFSSIGLKDINESLFNIWNRLIFPNQNKEMTYKEMLSLFYSSGEFFKVIEGLYVNYLNIPHKDTNEDVNKRAEVAELFSYEDTLSKKVLSSQAFELNNYMCLSGLFIHNCYSSTKFEKNIVAFPTLFYDFRKNQKVNQRILEMIKENIDMNRRRTSFTCHSLALDFLPYLYQLIQPEIREINPELMNKKEIKQIKTSVALMLLCGLNFSENNIDDIDNQYNEISINYEPNIKRILTFANVKDNHRLTMNQKFILKMEHEKMKSIFNILSDRDKGELIPTQDNKGDLNSIMNTLALGKKKKSNQFQAQEYMFIYKFHEGVTNCVRRPLDISYFNKAN